MAADRPVTLTAVCVGLLALLASGAGPKAQEVAEDVSDHVERSHRLVRITSGGVHPKTLRLAPEEAFGWMNYAGGRIAQVFFDAGVAKHLVCESRTAFRIEGERLVSRRMEPGDFATLCRLEPGAYAYRVELRSGAGSGGGDAFPTLEGRLVVEDAS